MHKNLNQIDLFSDPMKLYYHTGWGRCALHGCPNGESAWRDVFFEDVPGFEGWKVLSLDAPQGVTFVVKNEAGTEWDNNAQKNYAIDSGEGAFTLRNGRLQKVSSEKILIVSDLDHTMIGHDKDPDNVMLEEFKAHWLGKFAFGGSRLVYSTGRNKKDALGAAAEKQLLRPDLLICGVGTELYNVPNSLPLLGWQEFADKINLDDSWKQKVADTFDRMGVETKLAASFAAFELRGNVENDPYRIPSAYCCANGDFQADIEAVKKSLGPDVQVISSGGSEWKLVDFCSADAGKLKALQFAMTRLGFTEKQTIACGDSGNDESMYRCPGIFCVAVANALDELVQCLRSNARDGPDSVVKGQTFKTLQEGTVLYASRDVAGGIVEALNLFWPSS